MFHYEKSKSNINDGELLSYLEIINLNSEHEVVISQEYHIEKSLFGSPSKHDWYNVYLDLGEGKQQRILSCVNRDMVRAYLWGFTHGIKQGGKLHER